MRQLLVLAQGAGGQGTTVLWVVVCVAFVGFVATLALTSRWIMAWFKARRHGVRVDLMDIIGMKLRRVDARWVIKHAILLKQAGLEVPLSRLETHYLAGGRLERVVEAIVIARQARVDLPWDHATVTDLAGKDVVAMIRMAIRSGPNGPHPLEKSILWAPRLPIPENHNL